jgi:hypothetical protein
MLGVMPSQAVPGNTAAREGSFSGQEETALVAILIPVH